MPASSVSLHLLFVFSFVEIPKLCRISFTWKYYFGRSVILRHQFTAYCPYAVELFDIVVIAIFGIPGTVFLAIFHFSSNNRSRYEKSYPLSEDTIFYSKIQQLFILSIILSSHEPFPLYWVTSSPDTFA